MLLISKRVCCQTKMRPDDEEEEQISAKKYIVFISPHKNSPTLKGFSNYLWLLVWSFNEFLLIFSASNRFVV